MAEQFHLSDLFEIVVQAIPDRLALIGDHGETSYAEMNTRADRLAAALYANGLRRGDHVGLYLVNGPEYLESMIAIFKLGAVPFNVNYRYGFEELEYLFGDADASAVIHGVEFSSIVGKLKATLPELNISIVVGDGQMLDNAMLKDVVSKKW